MAYLTQTPWQPLGRLQTNREQYITTHRPLRPRPDPVPLGLARRVPSQLGQSSPQRVPRTWSRQPSRVGAPRCCLLSSMRVCSPPLGMSGRLLGGTECHHAPNQWTLRLTEHHTSSRLQQPHHLVMHTCSIWAAPPWVCLAVPCTSYRLSRRYPYLAVRLFVLLRN